MSKRISLTYITAFLSLSALAHGAIFPGNAGSVETAVGAVNATGSSALSEINASLAPLNSQQLYSAYDQMQPALFKGLTVAVENNAFLVRSATNYRFRYLLDNQNCFSPKEEPECCEQEEKTFHAWADGVGDKMKQSSIDYYHSPQVGYLNNTGGVIAGLEAHFFKLLYAGAFGAYTYNRVKWEEGQGSGDVNSGYAGLYLAGIGRRNYFNMSFAGGWSGVEAQRGIVFPGVNQTAVHKHHGAQAIVHFDMGNNNDYGGISFRPFESVDFIFQGESPYQETGAGAYNLDVRKTHATMIRNELGLNWALCRCHDSFKMNLDTKFSWVREVRIYGKTAVSTFVDTDVPFDVIGYFPYRNMFSVGASYAVSLCNDRFNMSLYYNGIFANRYQDNSLGAQINCGF